MNPEEVDDPSKHKFTNPLEEVDPSGVELEPGQRMWEALNSDQAKQHFDSIAHITGEKWREAGFAIYSDPESGLRVSELAQSVDSAQRSSAATAVEAMHMHESLDMSKLTYLDSDADEPKLMRKDIKLLLHSHPAGHDAARVDDWLRPSISDLDLWEKDKLSNPGLTEAIAVVAGEEMKMLLYRHNPDRNLIPYYQQLDGSEGKNRVIRELKESNLDVAVLQYDLSKKEFAEESQSVLQEFLR